MIAYVSENGTKNIRTGYGCRSVLGYTTDAKEPLNRLCKQSFDQRCKQHNI